MLYRQAINTNPEPKGVPKVYVIGMPLWPPFIEEKIKTNKQVIKLKMGK
jgi:hypothetical protein